MEGIWVASGVVCRVFHEEVPVGVGEEYGVCGEEVRAAGLGGRGDGTVEEVGGEDDNKSSRGAINGMGDEGRHGCRRTDNTQHIHKCPQPWSN